MIKFYYSPSCTSCRKVKKWFDDNNIPYIGKDIFSGKLTKADLLEIISKCENGTDDIIAPRSKVVLESEIDFDSMKVSELIDFLLKYPNVIRRPIIVNDRVAQVGYNSDDLEVFIPQAKQTVCNTCTHGVCPRYDNCITNGLTVLAMIREGKNK